MSELHKFIFEGMAVRGMVVRLTDGWQEVVKRRAESGEAFAAPVRSLLGEMAAASVLMQANIRFDGALVLHPRRMKPAPQTTTTQGDSA